MPHEHDAEGREMNQCPLALVDTEAAELVCARSVHQFRREVARGTWPPPIDRKSRPQRWSRIALLRRLGNEKGEQDPRIAALESRLGIL